MGFWAVFALQIKRLWPRKSIIILSVTRPALYVKIDFGNKKAKTTFFSVFSLKCSTNQTTTSLVCNCSLVELHFQWSQILADFIVKNTRHQNCDIQKQRANVIAYDEHAHASSTNDTTTTQRCTTAHRHNVINCVNTREAVKRKTSNSLRLTN